MKADIRNATSMNGLIEYFADELGWHIDLDDFEDIEDVAYDFDASDIGLKEEAFARIKSLKQLPPLVDGQKWGVFCVEFDSKRFEITALRKILSGLIPRRRNAAEHAVWRQQDLLFICFWGVDNNRTIGIAHFEENKVGLPQIKMISCAPALEDFTQIKIFENRLKKLTWPLDAYDTDKWREEWASAFISGYKQTIRDASTLTIQLAIEAQEIRNRILSIFDVESSNGYVHLLYEKFKDTLIHDMTEEQFADMYAQTVVYGLFSARCMDETMDDFSASEAITCIPNTNPFLKSLMEECIGAQRRNKLSFDELEINNVVDLLKATRTDEIIKDFNRQTGGGKEDPVIHFYEEFLAAYDKTQKVQRGVYYTPQPVVSFMVRAVDSIIKKEFELEDGLASTDTKTIKIKRMSKKKIDGYHREIDDTEEVPAVQVLDPATGTGTFIRQVILQTYDNFKQRNNLLSADELKYAWNKYVPEQLLPRVHAFELMMAPYAVAHMKLAMVLKDTGYEFGSDERLNVYLTNSLEEPGSSDAQIKLWDDPLATESVYANAVKKNKGINVIIGNPPYSSESANNITWIQELMEDFKKEPKTCIKLQERNYKAINDDYVKFIRVALEFFKETSNDILAYINPHGFLDNPTFRGMRYSLLQHFSEIYIVELHGDYRRKEVCPDGSKDENVFDIQQGVCIFIGIKKAQRTEPCRVFRKDIYGLRSDKYEWLNKTDFASIEWDEITLLEPYFFFANRELDSVADYNKGFSVKELFLNDVMGVATAKDSVVIDTNKSALKNKFIRISDRTVADKTIANELFGDKVHKANIGGINPGWSLTTAREAIYEENIEESIKPISYRPFDKRYIFYDSEWIDRDRFEIMKHFIEGPNYGLCLIRVNRDDVFTVLVSDAITDKTILSSKDNANVFPLYLYEEGLAGGKTHNFNKEVIDKMSKGLGLEFKTLCDNEEKDVFYDAYDVLCYIYGILHSKKYREKYKDLLKSEFPKIPYPTSVEQFRNLVQNGDKLINTHLMIAQFDNNKGYELVGSGDNVVAKAEYKHNSIVINDEQRIASVDEGIWNYYIAGYQPLQKWLKDRKNTKLSSKDIKHYINMILAIEETEKISLAIDETIDL